METKLECLTRRYLKCPSGMFLDEVWELVKLQHAEIEQLKVVRDRWKNVSQRSVDVLVDLKNKVYGETEAVEAEK